MIFLILAFLICFITTWITIRYKYLHENISGDHDQSGPQKFHVRVVPRVGSIGIFLSISITSVIALVFFSLEWGLLLLQLIGCALPAIVFGLIEDLTKRVGIYIRLIAAVISAALSGYFLNTWVTQIQVFGLDQALAITWISFTFSIFAIAGMVNAYNIIDGFNGLASMIAIISLLAISFICFKVNDLVLASACLIVIGAISGFFAWNYPRGLIFLGDGGAYLLGFLIATLSILLIKRNPTVSPWFALLVNAYPVVETMFTIWRRKIHQDKNPGLPDGIHFHSLIYRRLIRLAKVNDMKDTESYAKNAKTSPYIWLLSSLAIIPSIIWWQTTWVLQCFAFLFCVTYLWIYNAIIKFKTPDFLKKRLN